MWPGVCPNAVELGMLTNHQLLAFVDAPDPGVAGEKEFGDGEQSVAVGVGVRSFEHLGQIITPKRKAGVYLNFVDWKSFAIARNTDASGFQLSCPFKHHVAPTGFWRAGDWVI